MSASLLFNGLLVSAVLTVAAMVAHLAERGAGRPVRWIWGAMLALSLALTLLAPFRAHPRLPSTAALRRAPVTMLALQPTPETRGLASWMAGRVRAVRAAIAAGSTRLVAPVAALDARLASRAPRAAPALGFVWFLASGITIALFMATYGRVVRSRSGWPRVRLHDTDVRLSPDAGPAVVGFRPMEIVLPRWVLDRDRVEQQLVIAHERAHVRAHDPWLLAAGCGVAALMPWNPFAWYGLARLRLAIELDCDRRVLRAGASPREYGSLLVDLSAHRPSLGAMLPALSYGPSTLERRLLAMTQRPARHTLLRRAGAVAVGAVAVLAACESKLPTAAEVEALDAKSVRTTVTQLALTDSSRVQYVVDDRKVTLQEAELIPSTRIAAVEVVKGRGREAEIRLRTTRGADTLELQASKIRVGVDSIVGEGGVTFERRLAPTRIALREEPVPTVRIDSLSPSRSPRLQLKESGRFDGLYVIDGRVVPAEAMSTLAPDRIESIEVLKGASARERYSDPRAQAGVILVTTKRR